MGSRNQYTNETLEKTLLIRIKKNLRNHAFHIFTDLTPYKCLGHIYVNEEDTEELSISSFIFLPIDAMTFDYDLGDIVIANQTSLNIETVQEIRIENGTVFVHTELTDCSDNSSFVNG